MVTQNNIFKKYYNWIIIFFILFSGIIGYFFTYTNYYNSYLFYPDKEKIKLIAERRSIIKGKTKIEKIRNTIEELLLGPMDYNINSFFPVESKLMNIRLENKTLHINLNRETIMNLNYNKEKNISSYYLMMQSIIHTVHYQFRNIENYKFYFNGKDYKYIGDIKHPENGFKPDLKILK